MSRVIMRRIGGVSGAPGLPYSSTAWETSISAAPGTRRYGRRWLHMPKPNDTARSRQRHRSRSGEAENLGSPMMLKQVSAPNQFRCVVVGDKKEKGP
jgi:hypothetical protein